MRRTRFDQDQCPIARTTDLLGDWWTPMVMRSAFFGCRRFEEFQSTLGVSRTTLTQRLNRLVDEDMLERVPYQTNPVRHEYRLTPMGVDLFPEICPFTIEQVLEMAFLPEQPGHLGPDNG